MRLQQMFFQSHLDEGEQLFFVAHKHWIEVAQPFLLALFFGLLLPGVAWYIFDFKLWILFAWIGSFIIWFLYHSMDWYFDALLVTNTSVIDVEWHNLFHRESSRVDYADLKEITYEIKGFWPTMLNFGTINIRLNSGGEVNLEKAQNPKDIELIIQGYKQQFLHEQKMTDADTLQEILSDLVSRHIQEHGLPEQKKKEKHGDIGHKYF